MGGYYDEIEIEDMAWDEEAGVFQTLLVPLYSEWSY